MTNKHAPECNCFDCDAHGHDQNDFFGIGKLISGAVSLVGKGKRDAAAAQLEQQKVSQQSTKNIEYAVVAVVAILAIVGLIIFFKLHKKQ